MKCNYVLFFLSLGQSCMGATVMKRKIPHYGLAMCMHVRSRVSLMFTCAKMQRDSLLPFMPKSCLISQYGKML